MKKFLSLSVALVMGASMMTGCSSGETTTTTEPDESTEADATEDTASTGSEDDDLLIYGIYKAGDQTWFIDEGEAAKEAVEEAGGEFVYVDAKMNPEEYLKAVDNAIANDADGVITCIPDQTMSEAVVDKLNEANIPVVAADDALEDADGNLLAPWVGIDSYVIGQVNGEWLANYAIDNDLVGRDDVGLLLMTMDTVSSCVPRVDGEYDKFTEVAPDFDTDKIFRADYDGTTDKGNTAASAVITAHPEITTWLVTGANEEGVIGAARALESAGLDKDATCVALGGYMAKDEFKLEGGSPVKASSYFSADSVGRSSVEVLLGLINGEEVPMETAVDAVIVTPDNYIEVMGDDAE